MFLDNAPIHTSANTRQGFISQNVPVIYNLVGTPVLNPIEQVFGVLKQIYKKKRLANLIVD